LGLTGSARDEFSWVSQAVRWAGPDGKLTGRQVGRPTRTQSGLLSQRQSGPQAPGFGGEEPRLQTGKLSPLLSGTQSLELPVRPLWRLGTQDFPRLRSRLSEERCTKQLCKRRAGYSLRCRGHFVGFKPNALTLKHIGPRARSRAILQRCRIREIPLPAPRPSLPLTSSRVLLASGLGRSWLPTFCTLVSGPWILNYRISCFGSPLSTQLELLASNFSLRPGISSRRLAPPQHVEVTLSAPGVDLDSDFDSHEDVKAGSNGPGVPCTHSFRLFRGLVSVLGSTPSLTTYAGSYNTLDRAGPKPLNPIGLPSCSRTRGSACVATVKGVLTSLGRFVDRTQSWYAGSLL